ncbi:MAG: hypothetical protein QM831_23390 [Kofleriaceae bacterium]
MSKVVVVAVSAALFTGCGFDNNGSSDDAGNGSDADGSNNDPCTLPDMTSAGVSTLSGCADAGTTNGPRGTARFNNPVNVALADSGNAYIVDYDSSLLRMVDNTGKVTTVFSDATFNRPFGIIMLSNGNLIVECDADEAGNQNGSSGTVWKIDPSNAANNKIFARMLLRPRGLVALSDTQLAYTDYEAFTVNLLDVNTGTMTTLAGAAGVDGHQDGNGLNATFSQPWDLVKDNNGDLIVAEYESHLIRKVTLAGDVTTIGGVAGQAGHVDGVLASAMFNNPKGMTRDDAGNIYISETGNHDIRKIDTAGMVTTIAGGTGGYGDSEDPMAAAFYGLEGLDISKDGKRLVIADGNNGDSSAYNHVRVMQLP